MPLKPKKHDPFPRRTAVHRAAEPVKRESAAKRGYDRKWREARRIYIRDNPLCVSCHAEGKIKPATDVDHIIPHKGDMALFWDRGNWQSLCHEHHSTKTAMDNNSSIRASMLPRWMPSTIKPLIHVCGPPAAGKTTYVRENAGPKDLIIDLDEIAEELGTPLYLMDQAQRNAAVRLRNSRLADFCKGRTKHPKCWLITTSGSFRRRKFWSDRGAETVVINPGREVCEQRIRQDQTKPEWLRESRAYGARKWA